MAGKQAGKRFWKVVVPRRTILGLLAMAALGLARAQMVGAGWDVATSMEVTQVAKRVETRKNMDSKETDEAFWKVVLEYLKNTFEYIGTLGEGRADAGQVWIAEVDGTRLRGAARPLASLQHLSWPVLGPDGYIYGLEKQNVVRINIRGEKVTLGTSGANWVKLVGVNSDGSVLGIIDDPPFGKVAILHPDGSMTLGTAPVTAEERKRQSVLLQESRAYADGRRLTIRYAVRGRGLDIFLDEPGKPATNLSDCGDDACGQPSLSPDGTQVAWIRSASN